VAHITVLPDAPLVKKAAPIPINKEIFVLFRLYWRLFVVRVISVVNSMG